MSITRSGLLSLILLLTSKLVSAQHDITINIKGLAPGSKCKLAHYYADRNNVVDSTRVDGNGNLRFTGPNKYQHGVYFIVLPNKRFTEFIIPKDDQSFAIFTDTTLNPLTKKSAGSVENEAYLKFDAIQTQPTYQKEEAVAAYQKCETEECQQKYRNLVNSLDAQIDQLRKQIIQEYPNTFVASLFKAMLDVEIPDGLDKNGRYQYYKNHYWDNVDLANDNLLNTPVLENKLSYYLKTVVPQKPDSVIVYVDKFIKKLEMSGATETHKFSIWWITNYSEKAPRMCMDKVVYHMAKTYYIKGKCPWADKATIDKMKEYVVNNAFIQCDMVAPDMLLSDTSKIKRYRLHDVEAEITVVIFWSHTCGHCMVDVPNLKVMYDSMKQKGVEVFAVYVGDEVEGWKAFIDKHELNWINVYDPSGRSDYKQLYNQVRTPEAYILDRQKRIVYKNPTPRYIGLLIDRMFSNTAP